MKTYAKNKKKASSAVVFLIVLFLAILFVIPFFLVILNSFKTSSDFAANPFSFPDIIMLGNYIKAFQTMNFANSFKNSAKESSYQFTNFLDKFSIENSLCIAL